MCCDCLQQRVFGDFEFDSVNRDYHHEPDHQQEGLSGFAHAQLHAALLAHVDVSWLRRLRVVLDVAVPWLCRLHAELDAAVQWLRQLPVELEDVFLWLHQQPAGRLSYPHSVNHPFDPKTCGVGFDFGRNGGYDYSDGEEVPW